MFNFNIYPIYSDQNTVQSIETNTSNKFESPAQQLEKQKSCRSINEDEAAPQDMVPNTVTLNIGDIPSGSLNFTWDFDFDFDEFLFSDLCHLEFSKLDKENYLQY